MEGQILITGVNRGLGFHLAKVLLAKGHEVVGLFRRWNPDHELIEQYPDRFHPLEADLSNDRSIETIRNFLSKSDGYLSTLVNNAGLGGTGNLLAEVSPAEIDRLIQVHCLGALRATQGALDFLKPSQDALVVNISSRLGSISRTASGEFREISASYSYRIAKAAQNMLTLCMSTDPTLQGITVVGVHPGKIMTETRSADANVTPQAAAQRLAVWIESVTPTSHGTFTDLETGKVGW